MNFINKKIRCQEVQNNKGLRIIDRRGRRSFFSKKKLGGEEIFFLREKKGAKKDFFTQISPKHSNTPEHPQWIVPSCHNIPDYLMSPYNAGLNNAGCKLCEI